MEKEKLFQRIQSHYVVYKETEVYEYISNVKLADIFGVKPFEIEQGIKKL